MPHRRVSAAGPEGKGDVEANASEAPPEQLMISTLARGSSDMPTGGLAKAKARMLAVGRICLARPHVAIVPVVVCGLMMGLGVWAVIQGANAQADSQRRVAQSQVDSAASSLQLTIQKAMLPVEQVGDWVRHTRNFTTVNKDWADRVGDWWIPAAETGMVISLAPQGRVTNVWPDVPANQGLVGLDILDFPPIRGMVVESMEKKRVTLAQPAMIGGNYFMTFQLAIYIDGVPENETWSQPPANATNCPPGLCYNATTRSKWWGNAALSVLCKPFLASNGPLANVMKLYHWQIWHPVVGSTEKQVLDPDGVVKAQPADAVKGIVPVADSEWELYIWTDSWAPDWKVPLIITVVVVSLVVGGLLCAVLLSWAEHQVLLRSVLPEAAINRMRHEMDWEDIKGTKHAVKLVEIETPAQQMLTILKAVLEGLPAPMAMVVAVQRALQQSVDVYRPPNKELEDRLNEANLDEEARQALARQLGQNSAWSLVLDDKVRRGSLAPTDGDALSFTGTVDVRGIMVSLMRGGKGSKSAGSALLDTQESAILTPRANARTSIELREANSSAELRDANGSVDSCSTPGFATVLSADEHDAILSHPSGVGVPQRPGKSLMEEVDGILAKAGSSWEFDAYALEEATQGHPLSVLAFWLFNTTGLAKFAGADGVTLARFLRRVEQGYPSSNPYHNARHAADVLQTLHMITQFGGLAPHYADQHSMLAVYLAAVVHDYEHRGLSTDFLTLSGDKLAVLYNDKSPMENHHLAASWALLTSSSSQYNFLSKLSKEALMKMRKLLIELVLGTDMKQHFSIMGQFSAQHHTDGKLGAAAASDGGSADGVDGAPLAPINDAERVLSLQMALKCADLGHLTESLPVHLKWVQDLEQEFFLQGDVERSRGMPISPLCDRTKEGVTKSQVGFFDFVCVPLFSHFTSRFKASRPLLDGLIANYEHWRAVAAAAAVQQAAAT